MIEIVVYTADVGSHDDVHTPIAQEVPETWNVRFEYGIGQPRWGWGPRAYGSKWAPDEARFREVASSGWTPYTLNRTAVAGDWSDRLLGRWAKCHAHVLWPDAHASIWVDSCLEITSPTFVVETIEHLGVPLVAAFEHPDRTNVYDEIEAAETLRKYDGNRHREMIEAFERIDPNVPYMLKLWAMTVLARKNHPNARAVDHLTWVETLAWETGQGIPTALDQLIFPFALALCDVEPRAFEQDGERMNLWDNPWFIRHPHRRES